MNYNHPDELKRMKELIGFRITEGNAKSKSVGSRLEYKVKGADDKTYGILYEGNKFYIKEAPKKDTEVLVEDFSYIGGENNKKENEYTSYNMAAKQLELKLMALREAYAPKKEIEKPKETAEWQVNETKEMRAEIERMKQISNNVNYIVAKNKKNVNEEFTMKHTLPEAPASNPSKEKVNSPFTDTAVAKGDKDFDKKETNPAKAGAPFDKDGKVTDKDMESDKKPTGNSGEAYSEKAKYTPDNSVADKKPSGGKVTRADESVASKKGRVFKITEEQVLAWNKSKDFMDKSHGTEIGSSAPFTDELGQESNQTEAPTEKIHESDNNIGDKGENAVHNTDCQNTPSPGTNKVGDTAPFDKKVNEDEIPSDEVAGLPDENDTEGLPFPEVEEDGKGAYLGFEQDYNDWENNQNNPEISDDEFTFDDEDFGDVKNFVNNNDLAYKDEYYDDDFMESKKTKGAKVNEAKLDDFGKHPAYQKVPMTTPPNKEVAKNGAKDWNDKSVENEKPYGTQIGDSAPFNEKVLGMLADAVMERLEKVFQPKSR